MSSTVEPDLYMFRAELVVEVLIDKDPVPITWEPVSFNRRVQDLIEPEL